MRIVIDMQGAQSESRFRGIGRYTMDFARAVVRNRGEHEVILALSGLLPDSIEPIRAAFNDILPQENIRVWYAPGPVKEVEPANGTRREVAELVREAFLASLCPDVIHVTSLFEGYVDDAVTSIGRLDSRTPVSVSLYDLIPLLNPDQYLKPNQNYATYYDRKLKSLKQAAVYLAISAHARQEGLDCLGVDAERFENISTAIAPEFQVVEIDASTSATLCNRLGLNRPFVLYTGGADERKNLPRLIEAWAKLPAVLRESHQLLLAGKMPDGNVEDLQHIAKRNGLQNDELLFSGYVSDDELVQLYNLCKLYVFPSWHEGFGLPALEAMACGAPVIGSNTSSLPEVIGWPDALFDPFDVASISNKMAQSLGDEAFCVRLRDNGFQQAKKFSWEKTAKLAIAAWEGLKKNNLKQSFLPSNYSKKPRLAFVSPMPPERTGIADYSAELLTVLADYYDIELIVDQHDVELTFADTFNVRDVKWLIDNVQSIDRVIYQMGNSPFHKHMLELMKCIPGVVVLHDFYSSGLISWSEQHWGIYNAWSKGLYLSHGYQAVYEKIFSPELTKLKYPTNWEVIQHALGIIVHSEYSKTLAKTWYGIHFDERWSVIPLLRSSSEDINKLDARNQLSINSDDFVVCSFGFIDSTKLSHRLLDAWLKSSLCKKSNCFLIFVGDNHGGDYGEELNKKIKSSQLSSNIKITGFASKFDFEHYLSAADVAVQLRTHSRGETSAAVLDSMNHELPVIVNANGSMAELESKSVYLLPDEFTDEDLVSALEDLWADNERRSEMGKRAKSVIREKHDPIKCARLYADAIEQFYLKQEGSLSTLINHLSCHDGLDSLELMDLSDALAKNYPLASSKKRLFLDITATHTNDLKTGIERVVRSLVQTLLRENIDNYRVEPVYLSRISGQWRYVYARKYTCRLLNIPEDTLEDEVIDACAGDIILGLDLSGSAIIDSSDAGYIQSLRELGVLFYFIVYDLIPVRLPEVFPPDASINHAKWLERVSLLDGVIGISKHVSEDFSKWVSENGLHYGRKRSFKLDYFHLGADIENSVPSKGLPSNYSDVIERMKERVSFLMVGTIEPRKAYADILKAFEDLWNAGTDVNLVIVGKEGWIGLPDEMRRDIPRTIAKLKGHPENGNRLFFLDGISDEFLNLIYSSCDCLVAASYDEGFGLPLIEAAQKKLPIMARDIPVFREVAGEYAEYFNADTPGQLAQAIQIWLLRYEQGIIRSSENMPWLTWQQSAQQLLSKILPST
ncbi:glycosyltransferase [Aeromonas sp. R2-2]|uniref:glycosyltransferase n=1 Tax=Aeromonas sp. R2-2 TaxID=3138460 RepID=UPI0034A40284